MAVIKGEKSRPTFVNVWATWCAPCREEMPELIRYHRAGAKAGARLLLLSADSREDDPKVLAFLREQKIDFKTYQIGTSPAEFIKALAPAWSGGLPATFLFKANGELATFWVGKTTLKTLQEKQRSLQGRR